MGGKPRPPRPITGPIEKPTWEEHVKGQPFETFFLRFQRHANSLAIRYGGKVYLVGSALIRKEPRDYDIRIVISSRERRRQFGSVFLYRQLDGALSEINRPGTLNRWSEAHWRQGYEGLKQARDLYDQGFDYPLDVQVMDQPMANNFIDKPRVRLDTMSDDMLDWKDNDE